MKTTTEWQLIKIAGAIREMRANGRDVQVAPLYGAAGEPSIVIVVPGVRLVGGKLEACDNGAIGGG